MISIAYLGWVGGSVTCLWQQSDYPINPAPYSNPLTLLPVSPTPLDKWWWKVKCD
jgi:hypothetical protein